LKQRIKRYSQIILRLSFSSLALYYVLHKTDLSALYKLLKGSNLFFLAAACGFFIISKVVSAYRLNLFFNAKEIYIPENVNLRLYWLGMFYNLFLPGGIGGDGYKVYYLHKNMGIPVKNSILALLFDRFTGLFALGVLCMLFAIFVEQNIIRNFYFILAIVIVSGLFYFIVYRWFREFYGFLHRTNLQSLLVQIAQVFSAWLILKALGNELHTVSYLFIFLISSVVAVIPFTIGGVGAREVTFLYAADILQLDLPTSITLSLLFFFITALVSLAGVWYVLRPGLIKGK